MADPRRVRCGGRSRLKVARGRAAIRRVRPASAREGGESVPAASSEAAPAPRRAPGCRDSAETRGRRAPGRRPRGMVSTPLAAAGGPRREKFSEKTP